MKKIIHMSDLHVGFEGLADRFDQIVKELIHKKGDEADDFVIVITGDLIDNAHDQGMYGEIEKSVAQLKSAGFNDILVIPGNHDYGTGALGDKKFVKSFQERFFGGVIGYPKVDVIGDIAFIALDSMAEELHWYDALWSEGELGSKQLKELAELLTQNEIRSVKKRVVYLHHHPFDQRPLHQLKDSKQLCKVLTQVMDDGISIDALLYGHNHEGKAHNGQWGIARCYDAGSATEKPRPKVMKDVKLFPVNASIRVIGLEQDDINTDYIL